MPDPIRYILVAALALMVIALGWALGDVAIGQERVAMFQPTAKSKITWDLTARRMLVICWSEGGGRFCSERSIFAQSEIPKTCLDFDNKQEVKHAPQRMWFFPRGFLVNVEPDIKYEGE